MRPGTGSGEGGTGGAWEARGEGNCGGNWGGRRMSDRPRGSERDMERSTSARPRGSERDMERSRVPCRLICACGGWGECQWGGVG